MRDGITNNFNIKGGKDCDQLIKSESLLTPFGDTKYSSGAVSSLDLT